MTSQQLIAQNHSEPKAWRGWTDDADKFLQYAWNEQGLDASGIASTLGPDVSRSAVLGRVSRLRLKGWQFDARSTSNTGPKRRTTLKPAKEAKDTPVRHRPSSPAAVAPPIFDFSAITEQDEIEKPERTKARFDIPGLPRITPERVHARRALELQLDEQRYDGALRCICGKPGAIHCAKHKALLQREEAL